MPFLIVGIPVGAPTIDGIYKNPSIEALASDAVPIIAVVAVNIDAVIEPVTRRPSGKFIVPDINCELAAIDVNDEETA